MTVAVSVVVPAYREGDRILPALRRIAEAVKSDYEVLVVVDTPDDITLPAVERFAASNPRFRGLVNTYGRGPANAIRYGVDHASRPVVVVTMADGSDDPRQIDDLAWLIDRGMAVAAASRYSAGGQQLGGPVLKSLLSRAAGKSLGLAARVGTRDATNSFKAYSADFVREVGIHSRNGFEIGLELTAKARRLRRPVAELPTIWLDRESGESQFKLRAWLPHYLRWYRFAYGRALSLDELVAAAERTMNQTPRLRRTRRH